MKKVLLALCWFALSTLSVPTGFAQGYVYNIGVPSFTTQVPIDNGIVNVNNGEIHLEIPLATATVRGRMPLRDTLEYDSRIWQIVYNGSGGTYWWEPTNVPQSMGGWRRSQNIDAANSYPYYYSNVLNWQDCNGRGYDQEEEEYSFSWTDPAGTVHLFDGNLYVYPPVPCGQAGTPAHTTAYAVDGSGYSMYVAYDPNAPGNGLSETVYDSQGDEMFPTLQDPNGNYYNTGGYGMVDTLGRTQVTESFSGNQIYYDVLKYGGGTARYTITTETIYYNSAFQQSAVNNTSGSFTAIQSIQLPDGSSYSFTYDSGTQSGYYGELTSMTLPSGGVINFNYTNFLDSFQNDNRWLYQITKDGGTTTYSPSTTSGCSGSYCEQMTVTSPDQNLTVYTFSLDSSNYVNASSWNTAIDVYQGNQVGAPKLKSVDSTYQYTTQQYQNPDGTTSTYEIPSAQTVRTSLFSYPTAQTAQTVTTLDAIGLNPTDVKQWDYYVGTPPPNPTQETVYSYGETVNGANLPTEVKVFDGSGNTLEDTTLSYCYDQGNPCGAPQMKSGLPNHTTPTGPPYGDVTSVSQWINNTGAWLTTSATYDDAGEVLTKTDPNGQTTYGYDSTDTFVTSMTPPTPSSGVSLTSYASYDFSSSLLASTKDPNSQPTYYTNYDGSGRVGEIDYPDGGKTSFFYTPTQASIYQYQNASTYADTEILYDSYERESRRAIASGQGTNPWYQTDTCYDQNGRVNFASYAYQGTGFGMAKVCSGSGDTASYDALSRPTSVTHGDGSSIGYTYQLRATKVTDENGVSRITQTDSFGKPTGVCEISSNSGMPGSGSPAACGLDIAGTGFLTTYAYDLRDHSANLWQGSQVRAFQTDSLGRTIFTQEPEAGQTTYSYLYNATGLQVTRIRPQANQTNSSVTTTTTTQYDTLGRPVNIVYSDGTPSKSYAYDVAQQWGITVQNPKGRLAAQSTSANTGAIYGYDVMGRVTLRAECTPSNCGSGSFETDYTYDWVGNILSSSDGFGVTNSYTYSPANEVLSITSSLNDSSDPPNIVSSVQNGPSGPLSWQLGNGLSGVRQYDTMGRVNGGWLCQGSTQPNCSTGIPMSGFTATWNGPYMISSCSLIPEACGNYQYDEFGRLNALNIYQGDATSFSYVYDRWGNRWQQNAVGGGGGPQPHATFNTNNNQIITYGYDAAGNLLTDDGAHTYSYDAEGNMTLVDGGATSKNTYDAENQRVRIDNAGNPSVEFVFNPFGQRASVWDATDGWQSQGQTYWGSAPVEFYNNGYAHYQSQDWLGTERMDTNNSGQVEGSYVSLPFGDGFSVNGADDDTYHFAGMDYDYNSGYTGTAHAQFRQYYNANGLWMSPDPYSGSYDVTNPQSFNRYSYVLNNPSSMTDPSGREGCLAAIAAGGETGTPVGVGAGLVGCFLEILGIDSFFESLFGGPKFHGTLKPRPNAQPWDEYHMHYGANIADALGIPDAGCEFGACGAGPAGLSSGIGSASSGSLLKSVIGQVELAALFLGPNNSQQNSGKKFGPNHGYCSAVSTHSVAYSCAYLCVMMGVEWDVSPGGLAIFRTDQLRDACGPTSNACPSYISIDKFGAPVKTPFGTISNVTIESCTN